MGKQEEGMVKRFIFFAVLAAIGTPAQAATMEAEVRAVLDKYGEVCSPAITRAMMINAVNARPRASSFHRQLRMPLVFCTESALILQPSMTCGVLGTTRQATVTSRIIASVFASTSCDGTIAAPSPAMDASTVAQV